jgi:cystathionine beta-lyase/cystathionine gamma-synthase
VFEDSEEVRAYQEGRKQRDEYGRYGNPTWRAVERKLCELEGAEAAVLFASGMCAATTTFLALLPRGGHLVVTNDCYRRTRQFIRDYLTKLEVETTVIEAADTKKLADALRDDTTLFFTECPTNPYLRVIDLPDAVRVCHARGVRVVVDSTFASPVNHRAARHNENGLAVAQWLEAHPRVRRVWYPGLASHPDHQIATRLLSGFGGVVTFELDGDFDATAAFVDRCRIPYIGPSLGGVVRYACGIEDADDLIADLDQALGTPATRSR